MLENQLDRRRADMCLQWNNIKHQITRTEQGGDSHGISSQLGENITAHGQCRRARDQQGHPDFRMVHKEYANYVVPIKHDYF